MTINCKECKHSIFCETFGEYKCTKYARRIYYPERTECNDYDKFYGEKKEPCRCRSCLSRVKEED